MCLSLLADLTSRVLPTTLIGQDEIDRGLLLREAGLVAALSVQQPGASPQDRGLRVLAITERGRRVLRMAHDGQPVEDLL